MNFNIPVNPATSNSSISHIYQINNYNNISTYNLLKVLIYENCYQINTKIKNISVNFKLHYLTTSELMLLEKKSCSKEEVKLNKYSWILLHDKHKLIN
jgi:hypothetical protein